MEEKLQHLAEMWGYEDVVDMMNDRIIDSLVPAICTNEDCDYTEELEHDNDSGFCEECGTYSVKSASKLLGIM